MEDRGFTEIESTEKLTRASSRERDVVEGPWVGEKSCRTLTADPGLVIDLNRDEKRIGVEITVPAAVTVAALNRVLRGLGLPPVAPSDLAPLQATCCRGSVTSDHMHYR